MPKKEFVVGLDIGTTKISCLVGEIITQGQQPITKIIGLGIAPSLGFKKSVIIDIALVVESIKKAVSEAEATSGYQVKSVCVGSPCVVSSAQDMIECVNRSGLIVSEIYLKPFASAEAVLTEADKNRDVILIDMGGGTTHLAFYKEGKAVYSGTVELGGVHITNDISVGLELPTEDAELIKLRYGSAIAAASSGEDSVEWTHSVSKVSKKFSRKFLAEIIGPRVEEVLNLVQAQILTSGNDLSPVGSVVLTGGSAHLAGITQVASFIFGMPARLGEPTADACRNSESTTFALKKVNSPEFATAFGLVKYGVQNILESSFPSSGSGLYLKMRSSIQEWIKDLF